MTEIHLRSSVLSGQVICEINGSGGWQKGYVYLGGQMLAMQQAGTVTYVHQDPVTKSQRLTDTSGNPTSTRIELDPFGGDTNQSANGNSQPYKYTSYERDGNGSDYAMARSRNTWFSRFYQPDPFDGSYNMADPQSFNRYSYVQNDPVNFVDPSGLEGQPPRAWWDGLLGLLYGQAREWLIDAGNQRERGEPPPRRQPPNTVPLTPNQTGAIRNQIAGLLTDKCAKFIDQLVSSQTGKPYDSKNALLTAFDSIRDGKGGFFFGGTDGAGGTATGGLASGTGEVRISNTSHFTDPKLAFGAAFTALHEIIHIVTLAGDQQLSERVRDLGISVTAYPGHISPYPTDKDNRNLAYSGYWGQALKNACDPRGY